MVGRQAGRVGSDNCSCDIGEACSKMIAGFQGDNIQPRDVNPHGKKWFRIKGLGSVARNNYIHVIND